MTASPNSSGVHLSVVIPVYNEMARIPATLPKVVAFLESRPERFEVLVVDDGSNDDTAGWVERYSRQRPAVRLIRHSTNSGKGRAVRTGMLSAAGELALFSDADLSAPIEEAGRILAPLENGYDVVIGSRALKREWITLHQSPFREASGRFFNRCLRVATGLPFHDTQCGFKAFRREAAQRIFSLLTIDGFGFDAEALYVARKLGYRVLEVPVHWAHSEGTKIRMLRDGVRMTADLFRIRWNDLRGRYSGAGNREGAAAAEP